MNLQKEWMSGSHMINVQKRNKYWKCDAQAILYILSASYI